MPKRRANDETETERNETSKTAAEENQPETGVETPEQSEPEPDVDKPLEGPLPNGGEITWYEGTPDNPVTLRVKREHILSPHSVELRRNGTDQVVEARTQDHRHSETLGAKTVAEIVEEHGATALLASNESVAEIVFSPHTGEIVSIRKFEGSETGGQDGEKDPENENS